MTETKLFKENGGAIARRHETCFPNVPFGGLLGANPFGVMKRFTEEMDRVFGNFAAPEYELWAPPIEVIQKEGHVLITVELAGIPKEEVKVEVVDEALVIEGERKLEKEKKEEGFLRTERVYGKFYRSIPLPKGAKTEAIKAEMTNGILEVTIPVPELKPALRSIPIKTGTK